MIKDGEMKLALTMMFVALAICSCEKIKTPERPQGVPKEAKWGGGADGGSWYLCYPVKNEINKYECTVYDDYSGDIIAKGKYILGITTWNESANHPALSTIPSQNELEYLGSSSDTVLKLRNTFVLIADGWVVYPFTSGGGKKILYKQGVQQGGAIQYE